MALQGDRLAKVGLEGFAMIEEQYGHHTGRSKGVPSSQVHQDHYHQYHYQQPFTYHYQGPQVSTVKEVVISRNEAATRYYRGPYMYRGPHVATVKEAAITSNEAAQFYGGQYIQVPTKKEAVITSDEAAQIYGGIVITDYRKRKPLIRA